MYVLTKTINTLLIYSAYVICLLKYISGEVYLKNVNQKKDITEN